MDWLKFLDNHSGSIVAISTLAYLGVTLLLWLETRASRVAASDAARVVVRYGVGPNGQIRDVAELLNFGPALATDVSITLAFVDAKGHVSEERSLAFPAMGPGDQITIMPGLMLRRPSKGMALTTRELADTGLRLRASWSWRDNRRLVPIGSPRRHRSRLEIDLRSYADTVAEGLIVINSSVESVLQEMREDRRRERFEDRPQRFFDDKDALPPEIRVRIEADRAASAIALWVARARYAATWLRKQAGARIRSHRR
jgi:hypothetical protein